MSLDVDDEYSQALIEKIASSENISLHLSEDAQRQGIRQIINMLPEKYRTVILLFFLEDKSYDEISDILQIPINTV
jgi:RNA polymerase sigma-70 factor (ECF subfamily)